MAAASDEDKTTMDDLHDNWLNVTPISNDTTAPIVTADSVTANDIEMISMCDMYTLVCGDARLTVAAEAMKKCSGYVRTMLSFTNHVQTSDGDVDDDVNHVINLDHLEEEGIQAVQDFVSSNNVNLKLDNIQSVIVAADFLDIPSLLDLCGTYLASAVTMDNCFELLQLLTHFEKGSHLDKIFHGVRRFFLLNIFHSVTQEQLNYLSKRQLSLILGDDTLKIKSELIVLDIVKHWVVANRGIDWDVVDDINPDDYAWTDFADLVNQVRWPLIRSDDLQMIELSGVGRAMNQIPKCRDILASVRDYHNNIHEQPFKQTLSTRVRSYGPSMLINDGKRVYGLLALDSDVITALNCADANYWLYESRKFISVNNFLYFCGGCTLLEHDGTESCYRYDPRFNTWLELSPMAASRMYHVLLKYGNKLYVIGGFEANLEEPLQTCECFDIQSNKWSSMADYCMPVNYHAGCVVDGTIYVSGGKDGVHQRPYVNPDTYAAVFKCKISDGKWEECASMLQARSLHTMDSIGEHIYVIGCRSYVRQDTIERYSIETNEWTLCRHTLSLFNSATYVNEDKIYIVGGNKSIKEGTKSVRVFSEEDDEISTHAELPFVSDGTVMCAWVYFPHYMWPSHEQCV